MTIIDYFMFGVVAMAAIYVDYRLFLGWRNPSFPQDEGRTKAERLNASNLES